MNDTAVKIANCNLKALRRNPYPGRGIVAGLNKAGTHLIQLYWIMGRSENSRNRLFVQGQEHGHLGTEPIDPAKVTDASLVMYNAMRERGLHYIVSNGRQTDTVAAMQPPIALDVALKKWLYEPDAPNYTPRITAMTMLRGGVARINMAILRHSALGMCDRAFYELQPVAGYGHCITTYEGDGDPLPSFTGDPRLVPLSGKVVDILQTYWDALDRNNRIAIAMKTIDTRDGASNIHIINGCHS